MRFQCPFCNNVIEIPDEYRGYRVACSSCDKRIIAPSTPFEEGCVIGDFVIRAKLGEGAIGAVYKAFQLSLERIVALKILSNKHITEKGLIEFQREARAAAKLIHVNLVQSYAVGEDNGICYMAMTYINGETLKSRIRRTGPIPCDEALHIIQQVAEALHYAWTESHLIHRDVKPDNIMLSENGIVKLTDLGLAMNQAEWRQDMDISGSPSYMSPEQFAGEKLDTRSDIYSLGVTLYQMLSGELPFDAETLRSIARQHFEVAVPDINKKVSGLPPSVGKLIKKMMAKTPEKRFRDMEELLSEIWQIRQLTAPNQDMVPDVHTISLRRLDYDVQLQQKNDSPSPSASALPQKNENEKSSGRVYFGMLLLIFLLITIIAVLAVSLLKIRPVQQARQEKQEEKENPIYEQLANFENLVADPALGFEELQKSATPLLAELEQNSEMHPVQKDALENFVLNLLKDRTAKAREAEIQQQLDEQRAMISSLKLELESSHGNEESLKKTVDEQQRKISDQITQLAEMDLLKKDLEKVRKDLLREQKMAQESAHSVQNGINRKLLLFWEKQDYEACTSWLDEMKEKYPQWNTHLDNLKRYNRILIKTADKLKQVKTESAGLVLYSGTVSHLENGVVCCFVKDANGSIKVNKIPWNELPTDDILSLINHEKRIRPAGEKPVPPLFAEDQMPLVRSVYNIMTGDCSSFYATAAAQNAGTVLKLIPEEDLASLRLLADIKSQALADLIRILCENGKVSAKILFQRYQKFCQNSPAYTENIKALQPYFEKKESVRPVDKTAAP